MSDLNKDDLTSLESVNLTDLKIILSSGTPTDVVVICGNKQIKGIKSIRFEIDRTFPVGKVFIEAYVRDIMIDAKSIDTTVVEIKLEEPK